MASKRRRNAINEARKLAKSGQLDRLSDKNRNLVESFLKTSPEQGKLVQSDTPRKPGQPGKSFQNFMQLSNQLKKSRKKKFSLVDYQELLEKSTRGASLVEKTGKIGSIKKKRTLEKGVSAKKAETLLRAVNQRTNELRIRQAMPGLEQTRKSLIG